MKTRLLTAAIALPIIIASIILPVYFAQAIWLFVAIAGFALAAGLFEFYSPTKKLELKADAAIGYAGSAALFVGFVFDAPARMPDILLLTIALVIAAVLNSYRNQKTAEKGNVKHAGQRHPDAGEHFGKIGLEPKHLRDENSRYYQCDRQ